MSYVPLVVAGVSALSSYLNSRTANRRLAQRQAQMRRLASPEHLKEVIGKLAPFYREIAAAGLGPSFLQESARQISNAGMSGTGVGEAMRMLAPAAVQSGVVGAATETAQGVVQNELGAQGSVPIATANPLTDALLSGVRGYVGASEAARTRQTQSAQKVMGAPAVLAPTQTPVQYPTGPFPGEPPLFPQTQPLERVGANI